jgi:outer membrane murein-binding lipoprotein Lpp
MGVIWKSLMFLASRGPEILEAGRAIHRSLNPGLALPAGDPPDGRIEALEREVRTLNEERLQLSLEVERLTKDIGALRVEAERARGRARTLAMLFAAFVAVGLVLGAVVLARFP